MEMLTMQQTVDYLEHANIKQSIDKGHAIIHTGKNIAGIPFVLVNDMHGKSVLTEAL